MLPPATTLRKQVVSLFFSCLLLFQFARTGADEGLYVCLCFVLFDEYLKLHFRDRK